MASVEVDVVADDGRQTTANLAAWFDFDQDSQWEVEERITRPDVAGLQRIAVTVPQAEAGNPRGANLFSRFRVSTADVVNPTGELPDGEVEDHALPVHDCGTGPTSVTLTLPADRETLPPDAERTVTARRTLDDAIEVITGSGLLFRAPANCVKDLLIVATEFNDRLILDEEYGSIPLQAFTSGAGEDVLEFSTLTLDAEIRGTNATEATISRDGRDFDALSVEAILIATTAALSVTIPAENDPKIVIDNHPTIGQSQISSPAAPRVVFGNGPAVTLNAGDGDNTIEVLGVDDDFTGDVVINGDGGSDTIDAGGFDKDLFIDGGGAGDIILAGDGDDTITVDPFDIINGGEGFDVIIGPDGLPEIVPHGPCPLDKGPCASGVERAESPLPGRLIGTEGDDTIVISKGLLEEIEVNVNGEKFIFKFPQLDVDALGGKDKVTVDPKSGPDMTLDGGEPDEGDSLDVSPGDGNPTIENDESGDTKIEGGGGKIGRQDSRSTGYVDRLRPRWAIRGAG